MINLFNVKIEEEAIENIQTVLQAGILNEGGWVEYFEKRHEDLGFHNPVAVNSCTSALHLSLVCLNIGPGDEVILPAQTFVATGTAILQTGAKPIFCDIDPETGNIDPNKIKITEKTKAIIVVHWTGLPCLMDKIYDVAGDIPVIEDAAHAWGAYIKNLIIGSKSRSRFICFSFQAIKMITTGDGGLVCAREDEDREKLKRLRWFGFDKNNLKKHFEGDRDYLIQELGYKYNMNNITAAIGVGNLNGIDKKLNQRFSNGAIYNKELKDVPGIKLRNKPDNCFPSYWVYTLRVENRANFIKMMRDKQIEVSVLDRRIDIHPIFGGKVNLEGQEVFDKEQISIPVHDGLGEQLNYIVKIIKGGW
jgi:perosamine synthetase